MPEGGGWQTTCKVTAEFLDDTPANQIYTLTFLGYTLHNPRLKFPVPSKKVVDQFSPIPLKQVWAIVPSNPYYGAVRFRQGYGLMEIGLSGTIMLEDGKLPDNIINTLAMRKGTGGDGESLDIGKLPAGFPIVFRLHEAIPELRSYAEITGCFVQMAKANWNVEKLSLTLDVSMLAQPQNWVGV